MYIIYIFLNIDYFIFDYISTAYNVHIVNHTVFFSLHIDFYFQPTRFCLAFFRVC